MADTAIFDVDGTLVDTNYQHALAWYRAFRRYDITRPLWRIHRGIGMGGDTFVPEIAGEDVEREHGDALREPGPRSSTSSSARIQPFEATRRCSRRSRAAASASCWRARARPSTSRRSSSCSAGRDLADAWTTSDDAEKSKPEPDIVRPRSRRSRARAAS
jgi:beta-phosphoglucomutase-like phosphatase (HAD superfamily)